jgi:hypothetical protein
MDGRQMMTIIHLTGSAQKRFCINLLCNDYFNGNMEKLRPKDRRSEMGSNKHKLS